ncbi:hypothetical protein [Edaphobacter modestus]|uniref:Uncharacterized protein n=1 Tax=Edaphobacter modestus TaxID=388466 RepID=A0A4Q7YVQ2_9BACT|nr:hypothetical protein [Edaphobacter modestus]RZU41125.1 hypothetical protein BDD14_2623 [Edaphobacter modestus]
MNEQNGNKTKDKKGKLLPWAQAFYGQGKVKRSRFFRFLNSTKSQAKDIKLDRWIELVLATAIAFFALIQWKTTISNNESTSQQTNQLITAAKISAQAANANVLAANNFAASAQAINHGIADAVGQLGTQAKATQEVGLAAERSADTATVQLEVTGRPWLKMIISFTSPITFDETGLHASMNFIPINIGQSPAQNIQIKAGLVPGMMGADLTEVQKQICEGSGHAVLGPGYTLFPGDHYADPEGLMVPKQAYIDFLRKDVGLAPTSVVGCIDYTYKNSQRHHQTGFAYDLLMSDGRLIVVENTPLPPESVILMSRPSGSYAN